MRVEKVRGAVQRDRGLAGAGPARDDEHAVRVGSDRFVLLGLDRRDDVAHAAGAVPLERGEQRALARDREALRLGGGVVEHLVVEPDDLPALAGEEVTAPNDPHRRDGGRPVEGFGDRRPPVHHERGVAFVLDREAPDVPAGIVVGVEAAEDQRRVGDLEVVQPPVGDLPGDVALEPGLVGAALADVVVGVANPLGRRPHRLQPRVGGVDVGLFVSQVGVSVRTVRQAAPSDIGDRTAYWVASESRRAGDYAPLMATTAKAPTALNFTPDDDANRLLAAEPLAALIGMLLDQQVPMEWAFRAPALLKERLGGSLDARAIAAMDPDALEAVFRERPALHRFPEFDGAPDARALHVSRRALRRPGRGAVVRRGQR